MNRRFLKVFLVVVLVILTVCLAACIGSGDNSATLPGSGDNSATLPGSGEEESIGGEEDTQQPPSDRQLAQSMLEGMTLDEKVGQMFFVRCRKDTATEDLEQFQPGGLILFGTDVKGSTKASLAETIAHYQSVSRITLFIGADEEGGYIVRISKYPEFRQSPFPSPQTLYSQGGFALITSDTKEKAALMKELGFNVNLAPVCDVSENPSDYIYHRTFGKSAAETAQYVKTVVSAMDESGMGSVLKHFPGYGNNLDTHKGIAVDDRSYESFLKRDFLPFQAGIDAGAGSVLVSHNIVSAMDDRLPASLSPAVNKILREELHFDGVIMTDDLSMKAIEDSIGAEEAAVLAVIAGNDLLISTHFDLQIPAVLSAVKEGRITEARIDESVLKILEWKFRLGL